MSGGGYYDNETLDRLYGDVSEEEQREITSRHLRQAYTAAQDEICRLIKYRKTKG